MNERMDLEPLFTLFAGLDRKGPGSDAATLAALARCRPLPPRPMLVDLGCGAGASALPLARALQSHVLAMDVHAPYLRELQERAETAGLAELIITRQADFAEPPIAPQSVDLLWSEGAIYILGWGEGLKRWASLVRPGGFLALTEATWLVSDSPAEVRDWWAKNYPTMGDLATNRAIVEELGLVVRDTFTLPEAAWRTYYEPLLERCDRLWPTAKHNVALREIIEETRTEIGIYKRYARTFGYVFYILQVPPPSVS